MRIGLLAAWSLVTLAAAAAEPALRIAGVEQRPWIVNDRGALKSETALAIDNGGGPVDLWARIEVPGRPVCVEALGTLATGRSERVVHVPELAQDGDRVSFALFGRAAADGAPLAARALPQQQIRHWRLYVLHNSHQDIGYTDYQEFLKTRKWPSFWDQALQSDMPRSDAWPADAQARVEAEGTYQLAQAFPVRTADWFETLRARLAEGRFAYAACFGDMAHNNWGAEELARAGYFSERFLLDQTGVPSTKAIVMRDEPTLSWGAIDAFVDAGVRWFVLQHNYDHNLWRGTTSYPELFYAAGKSGTRKLLVWNALAGSYGDDELRLRGGSLDEILRRLGGKLMGYQNAGREPADTQYGAARVADGVTGEQDRGEWASNGEQQPWVQLAWPGARTIDRVRLFDRNNPNDDARGGALTFSDGSRVEVAALPGDGRPLEVAFPPRAATWVRFQATQGAGLNVGLSEFEVYAGGRNIAGEAEATASSTFGFARTRFPYPYDVATVNFTAGGDNNPMVPRVYDNIKAIADKGYAFPRVISANYDDFFEDLAQHWGDRIPTFKGTVEDWWNFGAASTAYETGINRMNHDKLAAAEYLATLASVAAPGRRYPYEPIASAYENLMLYDEHTWGSPRPAVDEQWRWKRNTALASDGASSAVLADALAALDAQIPAAGPAIVVYNQLGWTRADLVTVDAAALPAHFDLFDAGGAPVPHQRLDDGTVAFVAAGVPGLGYKTFRVAPRADEPAAPAAGATAAGNRMENRFFRLAFDAGGNVTSIVDKLHGDVEMVDPAAPHPLNQYLLLKEGQLAGATTAATLSARSGPVLAQMVADGATTGLNRLRRTVVLYDAIPRIDFVNEAVKGHQIANVEIGYFAFPLNVPDFTLRHEMPTGDMRPGVNPDVNDPANEQYFSSATAFYTVNRWIDASNGRNWGTTFSSLSAPLVSYGVPDIGASKGGWDVKRNPEKPWIYGMAFNNEWQTNFQKTQPGRAVFRFALRGHAGGIWQAGDAATFGAEVHSPLRASVIAAAQPGRGFAAAEGRFIGLSVSNVVLTAAKLAEANGEGLILRFNEIAGRATTVRADLGWLAPAAVRETDLVENDRGDVALERGAISFAIEPFGFKTFRVTRAAAPQAVAGVAAAFNATGCLVSWNDQPDAACYEVFRSPDAAFKPGPGSYVATVSTNRYFDPMVKDGLKRAYHYAVRAAAPGRKGAPSAPAAAVAGLAADTVPPAAPAATGEALHADKVTLSWRPATDNRAVRGYRVFRDGNQIADVAACFNSWMDDDVKPDTAYAFTVKAYDASGNVSEPSAPAAIRTPRAD